MDNLRGFLCSKRMVRVTNGRIRGLWGVTKGVDERIDEGIPRLLGNVDRMENDRFAKRVCVGECAGRVIWVGHGRDGLIP